VLGVSTAPLGVGEREVGDHEPAAGLQGGQAVLGDQVDVAALVHGDVVDDQRRRPVHPELLEGAGVKLDPAGQAVLGDPPAGLLDRVGVAVDPDDPGGREVLGQADHPDPGPARAVHDQAAGGQPLGQAGDLPEAARDEPGVERDAGPGHPGDPVGAALVPPQPLARGQAVLEAPKHLPLLQHREDAADIGRRARSSRSVAMWGANR
jgi:hypothetical protein